MPKAWVKPLSSVFIGPVISLMGSTNFNKPKIIIRLDHKAKLKICRIK
jgi:hypothetical protein